MQNTRPAEADRETFSNDVHPLDTNATIHVDCAVMVEPDGIEPTTPCLQSRCSPS